MLNRHALCSKVGIAAPAMSRPINQEWIESWIVLVSCMLFSSCLDSNIFPLPLQASPKQKSAKKENEESQTRMPF